MKNFLLCCVFAISFFLVESAKEKAGHAFKSYEEHFKNGAHNPHFDHLAILGSKKTEEQFNELEPEEAKKYLTKLIVKMDLDGDGKLSFSDLQSWIYNSYKAINKEEAQEEFKTVDIDEDGKLTWDEYLNKVYSYTVQEMENLKKNNQAELNEVERLVVDDKEKFAEADQDKSDALDLKEFTAFVHPHEFVHMHALSVQHALKEHDKNKDGKVDFPEFRGEVPEQSDMTEMVVEEVKFNEFDVNKDGFLDKKEMVAWILPNTMQNSKEEADHLISQADSDKDKLLTVKEVLTNYELFVGSQATDYGRQLHFVKEEL